MLLLFAFIGLSTLTGCLKKGDEDPFISLRSRKARVIGKWTIKDYNLSYTDIFVDGTKEKYDLLFSGSNATLTLESIQTAKDTIITWKGAVVEGTYEFDEDGEMQFYLDYDLKRDSTYRDPDTDDQWDYEWSEHSRFDYRGTWNFLDKIDNFKDKERITFVWTTQIATKNYNIKTTYTDPEDPQNPTVQNQPRQDNSTNKHANGEVADVWTITQLRNKEIKLYRQINEDQVSKTDNGVTITTYSFDRIGFETMTLSLKE